MRPQDLHFCPYEDFKAQIPWTGRGWPFNASRYSVDFCLLTPFKYFLCLGPWDSQFLEDAYIFQNWWSFERKYFQLPMINCPARNRCVYWVSYGGILFSPSDDIFTSSFQEYVQYFLLINSTFTLKNYVCSEVLK